ncbi:MULTISPECIES: ergothioneine biosynthesis protein EgtB [Rhodomicrobium]|uniref:ergothioneine biosynthesis protein EgtB n=1 Tax=Rhodomicrobium TaxID=1068 RepID=UPI000B4B10C2|nr:MULTISPECIES: ergothioneine biosynthesis protein EgtB [Rhodomicrobium]
MPLDDPTPYDGHPEGHASLRGSLTRTRQTSIQIAEPLSEEDQIVQAMEDASPTKWHLAHTTWFFEELVLKPHDPAYKIFDERFGYCFNSYYETVGDRHPRPKRSLLTRPRHDEVIAYREHVDEALENFFDRGGNGPSPQALDLITLGVNHEQQHQELMLTDCLAIFAGNPLRPAYREEGTAIEGGKIPDLRWVDFGGGILPVGHQGEGFAFDNESPRHDQLIRPFRLANRLVTNAEWLEFMADGGYATPTLWLADGWAIVKREGWDAPHYWEQRDGVWHQMTLRGLKPVDPARPVCHVSFFEADAFARWAGKRLPSEFEWEVASADQPLEGNILSHDALRPEAARLGEPGLQQMIGDVWEWTASAYLSYPGFKPATGAVGEYNGKFMCNQFVLKGASCVTPDGHIRRSYRNFFYPHQRWQFTGLRLADDGAAS